MDGLVPRNTYLIFERFSMPDGNSTMDAISVSRSNGLVLISLYTLMIGVTIRQFWTLIVLIGVTIFMGKKHSHNRGAASVGVWNAQASPSNVAIMAGRYVLYMKGEKWYPLMWTVLATLTVGAISAASILLPRLINIGSVTPANPSAVFVPDISTSDEMTGALVYALQGPLALRAVGAADTIGSNPNVFVEKKSLGSDSDPIVRINYHYGVTASDFGLQHTPGLVLNVTGSCVTEYSWLVDQTIEKDDNNVTLVVRDIYRPWNDDTPTTTVSNLDEGPPFAFFDTNFDIKGDGLANSTFAIVPSSLWRESFTPSTDPWYLTQSNYDEYPEADYPFLVRRGRPALSCWETAVWSHGDSRLEIQDLINAPGLNLSPALYNTFVTFLGVPMMTKIGLCLGRSSLASGTAVIGAAFNAASSSIQNDLERLVNASYIATRNVLVDTTLFPNATGTGIKNIAQQDNGEPYPGVGDFVISSPDIMTLSVSALIIVPVVLVGVFLLTFIIGKLPAPWRMTEALHATVLYSHVNEKAGPEAQAEWKRQSFAAYFRGTGHALFRPTYNPNNGELLWAQNEIQAEAAAASKTTEKSSGWKKTLMGIMGITAVGGAT